jgi:riboflavin synthase alpha subunit
MKYLITKRDMEIGHIIQGHIIKIGKVIKIINIIRIIGLTNRNITKTMDFNKTTQGVFVAIRKDISKKIILYKRKF